jgi:hypothetical protein
LNVTGAAPHPLPPIWAEQKQVAAQQGANIAKSRFID